MASLQNIKAGDIVEVDVKGRRGYALVRAKQGRKLSIKPIDRLINWTEVTGYNVVNHWRKSKTRPSTVIQATNLVRRPDEQLDPHAGQRDT